MKLSEENMDTLCDMLGGVYATEDDCLFHDGHIDLDTLVKCGEFVKQHAIND